MGREGSEVLRFDLAESPPIKQLLLIRRNELMTALHKLMNIKKVPLSEEATGREQGEEGAEGTRRNKQEWAEGAIRMTKLSLHVGLFINFW